ncbi:MAG: peptidylprolyl isomerase [Chloroflexi bacterium]|nr:peptidylprolyl isomerase [Chloroflexota bacterium]
MTVLDELIDNEIIRQEAARRQITVSPEEVQREIELQFGYDANPPTPTPTPVTTAVAITPTPRPTETPVTREEFERRYQTTLAAIQKNTGLTESQFRALFEISLLTQKVREAIQSEVPTSEEQIHAYHILVETEEEAKVVLNRLQAGEDFAALAKELSKDTGSAEKGGDLGWFPKGVMVEPFEQAAFALQPGQISEPVKSDFGYHIIKVVERDPNRPLDPDMLETKQAEAWQKWLEAQRTSEGVKRYWSSDKVPPSQEGA